MKLLSIKVDVLPLQCIDDSNKLLCYMSNSYSMRFAFSAFLGIVSCYGTVIKGMRPTIGDTVEIRRSGFICSMAEIIAFKSAAEGQEAIIWLRTSSEMDLVQGDLVKKN